MNGCGRCQFLQRMNLVTRQTLIVCSRADAIVSGQHRNHYGEVAGLLAITGEIKESMGMSGAKNEIFEQYKKKYLRYSSFQKEMKLYFNI